MEERPKTEKKKKKSPLIGKIKDIESSFDAFEESLNNLAKMTGLPMVDKAAYKKVAHSKIESRSYKSKEERTFWEYRQTNHFRGDALQRTLAALAGEISKRGEKTKKIEETRPLLDAIRVNLEKIKKNLKNSISCRDKELGETQEILDAKERALQAQMALGIKAGLKDDETAKKLKALSGIQEEAMQCNILSIQAVDDLIEGLEKLGKASGFASRVLLYKRHSVVFLLILGTGLGCFLVYASLHSRISPPPHSVKESPMRKEGDEGGDASMQKKTGMEIDMEIEEETPLLQSTAMEPELDSDALFKQNLLKETHFIPNCKNSYVGLLDENIGDSFLEERSIKFLLSSKNFSVEGDNAIQIIKVSNEDEMILALRNGAINSPYCIKDKLFLPNALGYDLVVFPVFLPDEFDPKGYDAQLLVKDQLNSAREKMGKSYLFLLPKVYRGKTEEAESAVDSEYHKAVDEYWKYYREAKLTSD